MALTSRRGRTAVAVVFTLFVALFAAPSLAMGVSIATIQGTITNTSAAPLAGIRVVVRGVTLAAPYRAEFTTGPDGTYAIGVPEEGDYDVRVDDPSAEYLTDSRYLTDVSAGAVATAFFTLWHPGGISGTVLDAVTSSPIEFIEVQSVFLAGDFEYLDGTALTDRYGAYTISSAKPGPHAVYFHDTGNRITPYVARWYSGASTMASATTVMVTELVTTRDVNATLSSGTVLGGRVTDIVSGMPIGSTVIQIRSHATAVLTSSSTAADGTYRVAGLPAGSYTVTALSPQGDYISFTRIATLAVHQVLTSVDFAMTPSGRIHGTVVDVSGTPIAGAVVRLWDAANLTAPPRYVTAGLNGSYSFGELTAGDYRVGFESSGYRAQYFNGATTLPSATNIPVAIGASTTANAVLVPLVTIVPTNLSSAWSGSEASCISPSYDSTVTIAGRLTASDGNPVQGAVVDVQRLDGSAWVTTIAPSASRDSSGLYSFGVSATTRTQYRLSFAGNAVYGPSVSPALTLYPKVKLTIDPLNAVYRHDVRFTVRGTISPRHTASSTGVVLLRLYRVGDRRRAYTTVRATIGSDGTTYSARVSLPTVGKWRIAPLTRADAQHASTLGRSRYTTGSR